MPHELFVSNATAVMKQRMPFVTATADGLKWVTKSGLDLGYANGGGNARGVTGRRKIVPGQDRRLDRIAETGLFTDAATGVFRPTQADLRLKEQDRDGIQAEVIYGLLNAGNKLTDRDAAIEFYRIYNEWLADFCKHDCRRLVGLASIPSHCVEAAVAEARRAAELGLRGLDFAVSWDMVSLADPYWDPIWRIASETGLAMHIHTINPPPGKPMRRDLPASICEAHEATLMTTFQMYLAQILAAIIHGGALERFPKLRIVLGESGIGWIPYVLDRMDIQYMERFRDRLALKMKPGEYWRRQCRATFQDDRIGIKLLDDIGVENVMWGSDYPHLDSVYPDSQATIERQFAGLPRTVRYKVTCENAGKFYGLM